jgi:hypothetical protein
LARRKNLHRLLPTRDAQFYWDQAHVGFSTRCLQNNPDSVERGVVARRRRAIFGVGIAVPKGCIWSNFWRNGATQKWRHRVFFVVVRRICAFAGMPGRGSAMKA